MDPAGWSAAIASSSAATAPRTSVTASASVTHHPRAGVRDHPGELAGGGCRVHRDGDGLGAQDAEVRRHELEPVAHHDHDPVAGDDPAAPRPLASRPTSSSSSAHVDAAAARLDEGQLVRVLGGGPDQEIGDVGGPRRREGSSSWAAMDGYFHNAVPPSGAAKCPLVAHHRKVVGCPAPRARTSRRCRRSRRQPGMASLRRLAMHAPEHQTAPRSGVLPAGNH